MSNAVGCLFVVATPIGNLGDFSPRAVEILNSVDAIVAEDTRHSGTLLRHFEIHTPSLALHEHNERSLYQALARRMLDGERLALVSDAGTPLMSDPGYLLVRECHRVGVPVVPIPGPNAAVCALSAAGLPTDRFTFEGFLPAKSGTRCNRLRELLHESRTMVFYEAPHRLVDSLADMVAVFGEQREAAIGRELTKMHETVRLATLGELCQWVKDNPEHVRGEIVLMLRGAEPVREAGEALHTTPAEVVRVLAGELPAKQAAALAARLTGIKKNKAYEMVLAVKAED